jgi:uncharacterized protein (TIGR02186 family)
MKRTFNIQDSIFKKMLFLAAIASFLLSSYSAGTAHAMLTAKANHDHITIDFFYHGSSVGVKGITDPGRDLIVKIASAEGHQTLKRKGKVAGVLWMNVGTLTFEHTPNLYEVFSTGTINDILAPDERGKYTIGFEALEKHVAIEPVSNEAERSEVFGQFLKFKQASNLYVSKESSIGKKVLADGHEEYSVMTHWPYQAAPGEYTVTVYAVKNGKVIEQAEDRVRVEQVGTVKRLADMAKNSAAFYGFLSIGIALGAGFGVGMVFRKGGGAH